MTHHDDVIMSSRFAYGSGTGPSTSTDIVFVGSGYRFANSRWANKLRRFSIGFNIRSVEDAHAILKIFEVVDGPGDSFLIRDWNDWNTTPGHMEKGDAALITAFDQPLQNTLDGTFFGDGVTKTFQMVLHHTIGATASNTRTIKKPQRGTVRVADDGIELTEGSPTDFTVDYANGIVTFQTAPGSVGSPTGVAVTWGGAFYVPVTFVGDDFLTTLETFDGSAVPNIQLIEELL